MKCSGFPTLVWGPWGGPLTHISNTKRRATAEAEYVQRISSLQSELNQARADLRKQLEAAQASAAEAARRDTVNDELRRTRLHEARSRILSVEKRAQDDVLAERARVAHELRAAMLKIASLERQTAGKEYVEMSVHLGMQHRYDYKLSAVQTRLDQTAALRRRGWQERRQGRRRHWRRWHRRH